MAEIRSSVRDGPDGAYLTPAVLEPGTLASIREANDAFLVLLAASCEEPGGPEALGLPRAIALAVRALGDAERSQLAACPYTLFNLRFEDPEFWRRPPPPAPAAPESAPRLAFARTAVFLAWHLANSNALAAALVLGMSEEVQRAWRELRLPTLERAAHRVLPHLSARWGHHPSFWDRLLGGAAGAGRGHAESVRLLGLQLLAAEGAWPALRPAASGPR